jgi:dynein heavy chain
VQKPYTFFHVTDARHCFAFGPGVLSGCVAESASVFYIQARDTANQDRTTGADVFEIRILKLQADGSEGKEPEVINNASVVDEENGRYLVSYTAPSAGGYKIFVLFTGSFGGPAGAIRGSPFTVQCADPAAATANKENNKFSGNLLWDTARELVEQAALTSKTTLDGISREVPHDNLDVLLSVKNNLSNVVSKEAEVLLKLDVARATLSQLKRDGARKDKEVIAAQVKLDKASHTWDDAKKQAPVCKASIAPLVKSQSAQTRKDIESFEAQTAEFVKKVDESSYWKFETGYEAAMASLQHHDERYSSHTKRVERMQHLANTFEYPQTMSETNRMMKSVADDAEQMRIMWGIAKESREYFAASREKLWAQVNPDELEDYAKGLQKKLKASGTKKTRVSPAYKGLDKQIKDFLSTCPLIAALKHKSMRPRHWQLLMKATKKNFTPPFEDPAMKLQNLLDLNLHEFTADVEEICDQATKEEKMEDTLRKLGETWSAVEFLADPYKEGSDVKLLKISEDDFETLETDQLGVQGMMASRYLATFEEEITAWQKSLSTVSDVLQQLTEIQRNWSYLEPLFIGSAEVRKELPEDAVRFEAIDRDVKAILKAADTTRNVKNACNTAGLLPSLDRLQKELDVCEKSLADFLNGKRRQFPRFYFVSKNDLLDILSNGSNPRRIMQHVTKVFLCTDKLELEDRDGHGARPTAWKFVSSVGVESIDFTPAVQLEGKVEIYLQTVLDAQRQTLRKALKESIKRLPSQSRSEWLMNKQADGRPTDPSQLILLVSGMQYVKAVESAFDSLATGDSKALQKAQKRTSADLSELIRLTQTNLSKTDRQRVMCMITLDAHGRDIIEKLILEGVTEKKAFQWQSQLKQRFVDGKAQLAIADARFDYQFEYLGNGPRLVVTPLTDRIYVTATQALNLKMGCAPAGPAGTGKTETTKDLANALAITCYVFNCSPEMDYMSLGNIFKGLSASGSWGCFDEFNRLVPEVLSVCSVQFKAVCDGIRAQRTSVVIEGDEVHLDWSAGAFITMNPGYLGRSELPEGLKTLFRPITVMVPDLVLICENMLMAEGFVEAKILASKFYSLYSLLRELLSKQTHYDWGLRAIKSVLVVAGGFKRAEPEIPEQTLLMRALRDFNTPKIVKQDEVIFFGLLGDLFPGVDPPRKTDPVLEEAVRTACVKRGLDPDEAFRLKAVQLEELLAIRHCVFVMGPAAAGKSNCWQTLQAARTELKRKTKAVDLDPKAVTPEELYGYIHPATREWKDGLLSKIMRDLATEPNEDAKWIVLDGDLDANWIESMNSVMDDNKMLTLASNERIPLKGHMRMVFEIRDLNFASPATVSRAGIIYISTNTGSQWRSLIASWLLKFEGTDNVKSMLKVLFERYCASTLLFIKKECKPMIPVEDVTLVNNLLRLLKVLLTPAVLKHVSNPATPHDEVTKIIETYFVFACVWAFGSTLSLKDGEDYRIRFSDYWRGEFKNVRLPSRETVFDYWLSPETMQFEPWKNSPHFSIISYDSKTTPMSQVTVPTPETCSVSFWMELLVAVRDPVMLVGYAGCGKTQLVNGLLSKQKPEERVSHTINFNFFTDARALQVNMETPLEKKTGTNFGPPGKANLVYFLDDLNLPEVDKYDTQSAIALVRQHFDYGHWYDRGKLQLRNILNCQYIACMNPTAGSFVINQRLQRHFFTMAVGFPGPTSLHTIYSTFLEGHLRTFSEEVQSMANNLLGAALQLHSSVSTTFRKSATNFHYEFNIRHLSNVFQGLLMAQPSEFKDSTKFAMLWLHESERVYGDRLVNAEDLSKYKALAAAQAKKRFTGINLQNFFGDNADALVFCHFSESIAERLYDRVTSMEKLRHTLDEALREYNETYAAMNLVLFDDAMRHVCRIARIILNPSGHALLVGVGGSGKQSLSRLAAHICGYRVYQITISGTYGISELKDDLKAMYQLAGVKEEGVMFLFTDSQITNERFLVSMNDLLASGNIPDLYTTEDMDGIVNAMVNKVKAVGLTPDRANCWNYFLTQVRRNLHVVLCFSPVGDDFRTRAKKFPALVNCTVIDWFQPWPKEALHSVGVKFLKEIDLGSDAVREGIEKFMPFSFETVNKAAQKYFQTDRRYVYTTPKSYLELLKLYKQLLKTKRSESAAAIDRLSNGLKKLRDTAAAVAKIEEDLKVKLVQAEEKRTTSEGIAAEVAANKAIVEAETGKANVLAAECSAIAERASAIREDAERDLEAAIPAVQRAMEALNTLDKKDLGECKTMATPPKGVDDVFAAVVVLAAGVHKGVVCDKRGKVKDKDKTWEAAKKALLTDVKGFMDQLMAFKEQVDTMKVPDGNWTDVRPYLDMAHFTPEIIRTKNSAAAGLCSWVVNIVSYRDIVVTVEPKKLKLKEANDELESANTRLEEVRRQVATLQAQLDELTTKLHAANAEKASAIAEVEQGQSKLELANRLTAALADENVRWAEGITQLEAEKDLLIGDVLLAASFISYIGPFTKKYRDILLAESWVPFLESAANGQRVPMSAKPNPLAILTNEAQIAGWNSEGLPDDKVSIENGCIVTATERWPLMIDPQLQGITWVREKEKANGLLIMRLDQKDMLRKLETALERGTPVLIENMGERIDAVLQPVISRQLIKKGRNQYLKLGDKEVEFNPKFRLYLHTKLSNPHYPPEVQAEACLVNFTVTESGLEEQLLALTVQKERPDLAAEKSDLIKQQNTFKIKIKELEDGILKRLADAEGDITEDRALIESLENTKRIATDIAEKSAIAQHTTAEINATSEKYRPVAHRAALLFFLMMDLFRVHSYYIYSLNAFVTIFERAISVVSGANDPMFKEQLADITEPADAAEAEQEQETAEAVAEGSAAEERPTDEAAPEGKLPTPRKSIAKVRILTDEQLHQRCAILKESSTSVTYQYISRGLFEKDKLTIATQLCLRLQQDSGDLNENLVRALVVGPTYLGDPGPMGVLAEWLPENVWPKVKALEQFKPLFEKLGDDMQAESNKWKAWFDDEKPEVLPLPGEYKNAVTGTSFYLLLLLRSLRPDRLSAALQTFVADRLGNEYIVQKPFDMESTYAESSIATPMFFVLFPGVDPTVWVEALGSKIGYTVENGKFKNISMGQGQEAPAMNALRSFAKEGGWLMLQNLHLMQSWLPTLERQLEIASESAHPGFRCFISAEPPPMSHMKNMPESLMQSCIKVANEAPADLLSNLTRSLANFTQERVDACNKPNEFKACLFTLCWYHAIVLGRRRFGQQGWSRKYSFNTGDLNVCANVLHDYVNNNDIVPWDDLRYIFGEIMYGGHITDAWDRRTNNTYLAVYLKPEILSGMPLAPGFKAPDVTGMTYANLSDYVVNSLPKEGPPMFGLHPNAEIGYLTSFQDDLFKTILSFSGGSTSSSGAGAGGNIVRTTLNALLEQLPDNFQMLDVEARAQPLLSQKTAPFVLVAMQECSRMNELLDEIRRSLLELRKGLDGQLNMSEPMEDLAIALSINQVPGRNPFSKCSWERLAWSSRRGLQSWFVDLLKRVDQLSRWSATLVTPVSLWLPGLFNPMAFLTAIMQVTARQTGLPLDNMAVETNVTTMLSPDEATAYPEDGMFVHGLYMEGARWATGEDAGDPVTVGVTPCAGHITDSKLKQLLPAMPLLYLKAVPVQATWIPTSVGYLRQDPAVYDCPVYTTTFRGPTYVYLATLKTLEPVHKWTLAGVALIMQEDE